MPLEHLDMKEELQLRRAIDHCDYLSKRMRMFPVGHQSRERWRKELEIAEKELERIMKKNGML